MRILILSNPIFRKQSFSENKYLSPYDVQLDVGDPNEAEILNYSLFDYDVSIVHITEPQYHTIGYNINLPKILEDTKIGLLHGRSVICMPESNNFHTKAGSAYAWIEEFGITLRDNKGTDIRPSGAGMSQEIGDYLKHSSRYHQIVLNPTIEPWQRLAVVGDTEIVVGMEHQEGNGTLVILPPPYITDNSYQQVMFDLVRLTRRYFERAKRSIPIIDVPEWVESFQVNRVKELNGQITKLTDEKNKLDRITYVLYGTGDELEESVCLLLEKFKLKVERQPLGSNIDLIAKHPSLGVGFAIEVTGTKGIIKKDSNKITQAFQHIQDSIGTENAKDRIMIVANTECHLPINQRNRNSYTENVVELLSPNGVLLITTHQLYMLWKSVYKGNDNPEDVVSKLYKKFGLYE